MRSNLLSVAVIGAEIWKEDEAIIRAKLNRLRSRLRNCTNLLKEVSILALNLEWWAKRRPGIHEGVHGEELARFEGIVENFKLKAQECLKR